MSSEYVMVPAWALAWLFGEGPDHEGRWFGDADMRARGAFWWRSRFRAMLAAAPAAPEDQSDALRKPGEEYHAYYFKLTSVGVEAIDRVLAEIARAASWSHHTDGWDDGEHGPSSVDLIQQAAEKGASEVKALRQENERLRDALTYSRRYVEAWTVSKGAIADGANRAIEKIDAAISPDFLADYEISEAEQEVFATISAPPANAGGER